MLFNSIEFFIFLPIVFVLYWFVTNRNLRLQNFLIVVASFIFYGWWDWRFLLLLVFSAGVDFLVAIQIDKTLNKTRRKLLLGVSLFCNLGILGFFKYFNFFKDSFANAFTFFGHKADFFTLHIVLPVGISFYTFQALSYTIEVYRNHLKPNKDPVSYFAFISFFPMLVAGPIERATNLLPQFYAKRTFEYEQAANGTRQMLWGLFKKVVIADNCAPYVNDVFHNYAHYSGSTLLLGAILFSFQIYGDFSGYSDVAIGTARLFGFNIIRNFNYPYFSRDISEFWRRWHISLTTWFRDYVYIPLGGNRGSLAMQIRNTFIIFLLSGLWHGANWTFLFWGFINACYFMPLLIMKKNRNHLNTAGEGRTLPSFSELIKIITTFLLVTLAWIFFRADTIVQAVLYVRDIFTASLLSIPKLPLSKSVLGFIFVLIVIEWIQRNKQHGFEFDSVRMPAYARWAIYFTFILILIFYGGKQQPFIYFQF